MIQRPTRISARGQKYWNTFLMMPSAWRKRRTPTRIRAPPQKILSRLILASISASAAQKSANQNIHTQQDEDDCGSVITQDGKTAEEGCEDQKQHCTDDNEVQSVADISARVLP